MRHEISPGPWPSCPDTGCAVPSSQPPGCREGCVLRPRQEVGTQTLVGPPRCLTSAPASTWSACPEPLSACHRGRGRRRWRGRGGGTRWQPCPQQLCPGSYTWDKSWNWHLFKQTCSNFLLNLLAMSTACLCNLSLLLSDTGGEAIT